MEPENRSFLGALDRLVFTVATAFLSLPYTLLIVVARPRKAAQVLVSPSVSGRTGSLLNPGVFFVAATTLVMVLANWMVTPEVLQKDQSLLGSAFAQQVASAVQQGDAWRVAALIGPIYGFAVLQAAWLMLLTRIEGSRWSSGHSLGASFYQVGASIFWITASSVLISRLSLEFGGRHTDVLYTLNALPIVLIPIWQYLWFFRVLSRRSFPACLLMALASVAAAALMVVSIETFA